MTNVNKEFIEYDMDFLSSKTRTINQIHKLICKKKYAGHPIY